MSTVIFIRNPLDKGERDRISSLLVGLQSAGLCQIERALVVTTEDEHVAALAVRFGEVLHGEPCHTGGAVEGEKDAAGKQNGRVAEPATAVRAAVREVASHAAREVAADAEEGSEEITFTNTETKEVHSLGAMRQMLRYGRVEKGQQFLHSRKGLMEIFIGTGYKLKLRKVED